MEADRQQRETQSRTKQSTMDEDTQTDRDGDKKIIIIIGMMCFISLN